MNALRTALVVAALATTLGACGQSGGEAEDSGPVTPAEPPEKVLAALPAPYNTADLAAGKSKFAPCRSCHTVKQGGPNSVGPNLYGVFGRTAGTKKDYKYSDAVAHAGFAWDTDKLDQWLTKPKEFMPGTKMTFKGYPDAADRVNLIAYLATQTGYKP